MNTSLPDLSKEFNGRRALITGGSRGIGAAIAQRLLDGGATVAVTARSRHEQTPRDAVFIAGDVRSEEGVKKIAAEALSALDGIDILVNNAGAARVFLPGITTIPDEEWVDSVNVNFLSAVRMVGAVLPSLQKSEAGAIINVSTGAPGPMAGILAHYGAAKAALNAYSLSLAQELGPQNIRVNIVTPGPIVTPGGNDTRQVILNAMNIPEEALHGQVWLRRFGQPHEVAEMVALLASDRGKYMTGHNYFVDGGFASA